MKNFVKWFGVIAFTAVTVFAFAACGDNDTEDGPPQKATQNGLNFTLNTQKTGYIVSSGVEHTSVIIPSYFSKLPVVAIRDGGFENNDKLTSVTIPATVTSIGQAAFSRSRSLVSVTCLAVTPPSLEGDFTYHYQQTFGAQYMNANLRIKVPSGSVSAYKAHSKWSFYADRIFAITE